MTLRKELKKRLSKLNQYQRSLPRLIDCSQVYGDGYYAEGDSDKVDKEISEIEAAIRGIDEYHLKKDLEE